MEDHKRVRDEAASAEAFRAQPSPEEHNKRARDEATSAEAFRELSHELNWGAPVEGSPDPSLSTTDDALVEELAETATDQLNCGAPDPTLPDSLNCGACCLEETQVEAFQELLLALSRELNWGPPAPSLPVPGSGFQRAPDPSMSTADDTEELAETTTDLSNRGIADPTLADDHNGGACCVEETQVQLPAEMPGSIGAINTADFAVQVPADDLNRGAPDSTLLDAGADSTQQPVEKTTGGLTHTSRVEQFKSDEPKREAPEPDPGASKFQRLHGLVRDTLRRLPKALQAIANKIRSVLHGWSSRNKPAHPPADNLKRGSPDPPPVRAEGADDAGLFQSSSARNDKGKASFMCRLGRATLDKIKEWMPGPNGQEKIKHILMAIFSDMDIFWDIADSIFFSSKRLRFFPGAAEIYRILRRKKNVFSKCVSKDWPPASPHDKASKNPPCSGGEGEGVGEMRVEMGKMRSDINELQTVTKKILELFEGGVCPENDTPFPLDGVVAQEPEDSSNQVFSLVGDPLEESAAQKTVSV